MKGHLVAGALAASLILAVVFPLPATSQDQPSAQFGQAGQDFWLAMRKNDLASAERHARTMVDLAKAERGNTHPQYGVAASNLALVLAEQSRPAEAEPPYREALTIFEKHDGPEERSVAETVCNLGAVVSAQGRNVEAEALLRRSLSIREKIQGPEHPDLFCPLRNLAALLVGLKRFEEAEAAIQRGLSIARKAYGTGRLQHPEWIAYQMMLADIRAMRDKFTEAEAILWPILYSKEKRDGLDHPATIKVREQLASLLRKQGRTAEAAALPARKTNAALDPQQAKQADDLRIAAFVLGTRGRSKDAAVLFRKSLDILEAAFGPEDPRLIEPLGNLASLASNLDRDAEAESLSRRLLAISEKAYGPEHGDTARATDRLSRLLFRMGRFAEAEPLARRTVVAIETLYGAQSRELISPLRGLADTLQQLNRNAEAEPLLQRAQAIADKLGRR